ncbi:MAG TPA: VOC family protein [Thermomicrobiales bacterium]|nr:VOC family protein [Thermomicrobiales bacterium]
MAYRFLLEVPRPLADDANVAVTASGVAQVVVVRPAHGAWFDDNYVDLTIAARNLSVIDAIYDWYEDAGFDSPLNRSSVSLILHNGRQLPLGETDPSVAVAAIRRDQPWVERTIPKIGDHVQPAFAEGAAPAVTASALAAPATTTTTTGAAAVAVAPETAVSPIARVQAVLSEGSMFEQGARYEVIRVADLATPEHLYHDVLGLELLGRIRIEQDGTRTYLDHDYDHQTAAQDASEATLAFMTSGPLQIVLQRVGRARPLDASAVVNEFVLAVDAAKGRRIKAQVLMRGYSLLGEDANGFAFRDPFGVVWNVVSADASTDTARDVIAPVTAPAASDAAGETVEVTTPEW